MCVCLHIFQQFIGVGVSAWFAVILKSTVLNNSRPFDLFLMAKREINHSKKII